MKFRPFPLAILLLFAACAADKQPSPDAGSPADAAAADTTRPLAPDAATPLYACPAALADASADGSGFAPARHPAGPAPVLAAPVAPDPLPATDVVFTVDVSQGTWSISQDIYGMNAPFPHVGVDPSVRVTSERLGGNRLSAYNWENNASNAGADYKFQNDGYLSDSSAAGDAVRFVLDDAWTAGAGAVVTVPMGDYVSADKSPGGDVRNSGDSYLATRFRKNVAAKNAAFTNLPDQNDDSVYQDEFVSWTKGCAGALPIVFSLDNEPELWSKTHAEIHPDALTYDELCERTGRFATAIKAAWPSAPVLGFVSYGWQGYRTLQNAPQRAGKGEFVDYFLAQMKAAEDAGGKRLVDYLDLHWYPEAKGGGVRIVFDNAPTDAANLAAYQDARMQAPRSLWDPSYVESSWIADDLKGAAIALIPRMKDKIASQYPGTKLSFTEWNYGGANDITGAIATADVLGIFGREKVDMAHLWPLTSKEPFIAAGFRIFRNYDGNSGEFGDVAIATANTDTANTSAYASLSSNNPGQVTVVAINKKDAIVTAGIRVAHPSDLGNVKAYVLAGTSPAIVSADGPTAVGRNAFTYAMAARSISVLVFSAGGSPAPALDGGVSPDSATTKGSDGGRSDTAAVEAL